MHPKALLDAAGALLGRVLAFEQPADRVIAEFHRDHPALGARDRRLLSDTAWQVVRRLPLYRQLAEQAAGLGGPIERRLALLAWTGDGSLLERALAAGEAEARRAALAADVATLPAACRHHLPDWLAGRLQAQLGDAFDAWVDATDRPAPLDLRVNLPRGGVAAAQAALREDDIDAEPTPYSPVGLRAVGKPALQASRAYAAGRVEVQDEGSQLIALALGARRGETVVDFCAGAGGKTLAIGAQMRGSGRIHAFDASAARLAALAPRLARAGLDNVVTMRLDGERDARLARLHGRADRVLVDAPCSGLGTLRRNPDLKWRHGEAALAAFAPLQRAVLGAAARLVKPGGRLLYATCSPLVEENEAIADDFEASAAGRFVRLPIAESLSRAGIAAAGTLVDGNDLRLWTHLHATDAFYAAAWQRAR